MGVLVEAGDERIRRHALSCGSTWFGDGARIEKENERAKAKHRASLSRCEGRGAVRCNGEARQRQDALGGGGLGLRRAAKLERGGGCGD